MKELGIRIKAARISRQMSPADVAAKSGYSVSTIQKIEGGKPGPGIEAIAAVAKAVGIDFDVESAIRNPMVVNEPAAPADSLRAALAANDYPAILDALDALGVDRGKLRAAMNQADAPSLPFKRPALPNIPGVGRANELKRVASTDRHDNRSVDDVKQEHARRKRGQ